MIRRLISAVVCLFAIAVIAVAGLVAFWPHDQARQQAIVQQILDLDSFQDLVREEILAGLKSEYQSQHHWGQQTEKNQVRVRGKWFEPRLEKTTKEVNDGLWQRFVTTLVEPDQNLQTRVEQIHSTDDGVAFLLLAQAKVTGRGQFERWRKGLKLFDVSTDADATVKARIECLVTIRREPGHLVDDVVLDPRVTAIELELVDLDLKRIGKLGHDVSRELGDALRPTIAQELVRREPRIIERANVSLHRHPERLRFSLDRFVASGWSKLESKIAGTPREKPN
ncbi:MAG TPA: hypothetical protein VHY91_04885 [Pirellulales bacterium]|jgi:hypothetical protein|nr:hypothetical protein [Pirellulales bacterium]